MNKYLILLFSIFFIITSNAQSNYIEDNWRMLADTMVEYQIVYRGIDKWQNK